MPRRASLVLQVLGPTHGGLSLCFLPFQASKHKQKQDGKLHVLIDMRSVAYTSCFCLTSFAGLAYARWYLCLRWTFICCASFPKMLAQRSRVVRTTWGVPEWHPGILAQMLRSLGSARPPPSWRPADPPEGPTPHFLLSNSKERYLPRDWDLPESHFTQALLRG